MSRLLSELRTRSGCLREKINPDWSKWVDEDEEDEDGQKGMDGYDPSQMQGFGGMGGPGGMGGMGGMGGPGGMDMAQMHTGETEPWLASSRCWSTVLAS